MTPNKSHHILTLVIQQEADIPRIRSKVKLLLRSIGAPDLLMTGLAVGASETARLLLRQYGGGNVRISLFPLKAERVECALELLFHGITGCNPGEICPLDEQALLANPPFPGLLKVFDSLKVQGGIRDRAITVRCHSEKLGAAWQGIHDHLNSIRKDLFADTEESYVENLRAKHDEVVRLLNDKTEQNLLLDQSNDELVQLSNDLEELARERAIIEMSLRIADQILNPTTIIGGMAHRLVNKGNLSDQNRERVSLIASESDKIEKMVKQFNAMAAQHQTSFAPEDLVSLLEGAVQSCPSLQKKHIRTRFDVPSEPITIHANRQILKVALTRILRSLTGQTSVGEELSIVITVHEEPQVTFSIPTESEKSDNGDSTKGMELVQQILTEHQAEVTMETNSGRVMVRILFPRFFREQGLRPNG